MPTSDDQSVMILNSKCNNGYIYNGFREKMLNSWCNVTCEMPILGPKKCNYYSQKCNARHLCKWNSDVSIYNHHIPNRPVSDLSDWWQQYHRGNKLSYMQAHSYFLCVFQISWYINVIEFGSLHTRLLESPIPQHSQQNATVTYREIVTCQKPANCGHCSASHAWICPSLME